MNFGTYHPVRGEPPLDEARDDVRRMVAVVRDASQAGVDGNHDQEELYQRAQQPRPTPRQPSLQVKLQENRFLLIALWPKHDVK